MTEMLNTEPMNDVAMTEREAAAHLNLKVPTLRGWRSKGRGPKYLRYGRAVRYLRRDLVSYMNECRVRPMPRAVAL